MEIEKELTELLREKARLFKRFELVTEQMMTDSPEDIDLIIESVSDREQLKQQIDGLDKKIRETAGRSGEGSLLLQASKNLCDYSELRPEQREIFEAGQELFGIITRIRNMEPQISRNMESMMSVLRERIKQNKTNSKFTGYMNNMGIQAAKGVLYDKKR